MTAAITTNSPGATWATPPDSGVRVNGSGDQRGALFKSLVAVFAEMVDVSKDATNPMFNSRYADLTACLNAARPILAKHKLAVVQSPRMTGDVVHVQTMIIHEDGGYLTDTASHDRSGNEEANDLQKLGTVITYLRRYALRAMLALGDKDDDGASIGKPTGAKRASKPRAKGELRKSQREDYSDAGAILADTVVSTFGITDPEKARQFVSGLLGEDVEDLIAVFRDEGKSSAAGAAIDKIMSQSGSRTVESIVAEYTSRGVF